MGTPIPVNRAAFTLAELLAATGGELCAPGTLDGGQVTAISTDTRALPPGSAFVALRGEVHDGHAHLAVAAERGAALAIVDREVSAPPGLALVRVRDTLVALGDLARAHRRRWCPPGQRRQVIAITGSAGKTTTRIAVAAALAHVVGGGADSVHGARGNLNNRVGVPMVLLGLLPQHVVVVLELGTNQPGEIAELCRIAEPEIGIVTLIAAAHTEGLGSIEAVAEEKGALFRALPAHGVAIGNADDPRVRAQMERSPARARYLYGRAADADRRILSREPMGMDASRVRVTGHVLTTTMLGEAGALACAAAITVIDCGIGGGRGGGYEDAFAHLAAGEGAGRLAPRVLPGDVAVIDDTYNANPASTRCSIDAAAEIARATSRRLLLVLGEMRELGALSDAGHDEVGRAAAESGAAEVFAVGGGSAPRIAARAIEGGVRASHSERVEDAAVLVRLAARPGDLVLVKGSRSIGTERVVAALAQEPAPGQGYRA